MSGPFVRLLGDKGLAARYIRDAKKLLAKVHSIRRETGVPVFALRRLLDSGALIQAQSFGMIDIITILPVAESVSRSAPKLPPMMMSGVVLEHFRPTGAPQGVVAYNVSAFVPVGERLHRFTKFLAPWLGPAATNPYGFSGVPAEVDERRMFPAHASAYNFSLDTHVVTRIGRAGQQWSELFIGGVSVLVAQDGAEFIGARIYDDVLAVALLSPDWEKLHVTYFPNSSLAYETGFYYGDVEAELNLGPTVAIPFTPRREQSIFDFHPVNKYRGTYLVGRFNLTTTATYSEQELEWAMGSFRVEDNLATSLAQEETGAAVVNRWQKYNDGLTGTFTRTPSGPGRTHFTTYTNDPSDYDYVYPVPRFFYPDQDFDFTMPLDPLASDIEGTAFDPSFTANQWASYYSNPTRTVRNWTYLSPAANTNSVGAPIDPAYLYAGEAGSDYSLSMEVTGSLDRSFSHTLTASEVPVWTGFNEANERVVCRIGGSLNETISGANTANTSYSIASYSHFSTSVEWFSSALISLGSDGLPGGTGGDADLYSNDYQLRQSSVAEITVASGSIQSTYETHTLLYDAKWKRYTYNEETELPTVEELPLIEADLELMTNGLTRRITKPEVKVVYAGLCGGRYVAAHSRYGWSNVLPPSTKISDRLANTSEAVGGAVSPNEIHGLHDAYWFGADFRFVVDEPNATRIVTDRGGVVFESDDWGVGSTLGPRILPDYMAYAYSTIVDNNDPPLGPFVSNISRTYTSYLSFGEGVISNRLDRGCLYDQPISAHVINPRGMQGTSGGQLAYTPPKAVMAAAIEVADITSLVNAARGAPNQATYPINITGENTSESDEASPRGLF